MCDMVNSYLDIADYGYDQINIGSSDINQILNTLDTNSIHDIDTIREREVRMFSKLNAYQPLQSIPNDKYKPNLYGEAGSERVKLRRNVKAIQLKEKKTESFQGEMSDIEYLQDELYKMEQKNNMFVIFIFFLVIVVLVQYAKGSNDPMRILVVPTGSPSIQQSNSENQTIEL
jgi:hypothetical protein